MINRYSVKCITCNFVHTLRITLGTDVYQEHSFACYGCGENIRVSLSLDFENRVQFEQVPFFSAPTADFNCVENCKICDEEGLILNLDPTFLVPEELLHEEKVFPWMYEAKRIGIINEPTLPLPFSNDIIAGLGGERDLKAKLVALKKAHDLTGRKNHQLAAKELNRFYRYFGLPSQNLDKGLLVMVFCLLGQTSVHDVTKIRDEMTKANQLNPTEYARFRSDYESQWHSDSLEKFIEILHDYIQCYEGLVQTFIYARRGVEVGGNYSVSNKDFKKIKMFYGNCYEDITASFFVPACINNISSGRTYDQFKNMDLKKYLTINKSNRVKPFADNSAFSCLYSELDSTIRNASHHGAMKLSEHKEGEILYRSGDTGGWKKMTFAEYSYRCNSILLCYVKTFFMHMTLKLDLA